MQNKNHQRGLYTSYLLNLSDVDKCKIVPKDSYNILFLVSGVDGAQGCVVRQD